MVVYSAVDPWKNFWNKMRFGCITRKYLQISIRWNIFQDPIEDV